MLGKGRDVPDAAHHKLFVNIPQMKPARNVGRDDRAGLVPERMPDRKRFRIGYIKRRTAEPPFRERFRQRFGVDCGSAPDVNQKRALFHKSDPMLVHDPGRTLSAGERKRHNIRFREQLIQAFGRRHLLDKRRTFLDGTGDAGDVGAQRVHPHRILGSDVAKPDDEDAASGDRHDRPEIPPYARELLVAVEVELLRHHQRDPDHVLGNRQPIASGRVAESDLFRKDAGLAVVVRTRALELQKPQVLRFFQLIRRRVPEDHDRVFPDLIRNLAAKLRFGDQLPLARHQPKLR